MPSKYIILQTREGERTVIYPGDSFYHDDIAKRFYDCEVISAGFLCFKTDGTLGCYGRSSELDMQYRGEDDEIVIRHQLRRF